MRRMAGFLILFSVVALPPATALAQYEGSDAAYREERREERRKWRGLKLGISAVILVAAGGVWVFKKMRGTS
jgi:hypothetical protein